MGRKSGLNSILAWEASVSSLMEANADVDAYCSRCKSYKPVDLQKIADDPRMGPLFSFWDRRPPCRACGYPVFFIAKRRGANTWPTNMKDAYPHDLARVTAAWRASLAAITSEDLADDARIWDKRA